MIISFVVGLLLRYLFGAEAGAAIKPKVMEWLELSRDILAASKASGDDPSLTGEALGRNMSPYNRLTDEEEKAWMDRASSGTGA